MLRKILERVPGTFTDNRFSKWVCSAQMYCCLAAGIRECSSAQAVHAYLYARIVFSRMSGLHDGVEQHILNLAPASLTGARYYRSMTSPKTIQTTTTRTMEVCWFAGMARMSLKYERCVSVDCARKACAICNTRVQHLRVRGADDSDRLLPESPRTERV